MMAYRNDDKDSDHLHIPRDSGKERRRFGDSPLAREKGSEGRMTMAGPMVVCHPFRYGRMNP